MSVEAVILVVVVLAFAWSIGAHYTGACMGMPYGSGSIKLVPALVLMALGAGIQVHWLTIMKLAIVWVIAPPIAFCLGYLFTHGLDRVVGFESEQHENQTAMIRTFSAILVTVGAAASFVMGANDVSNATGVFIMTHLFNVWIAGLIGGIELLIGVHSWGKPLLKKVAFDIVHVDLSMASAAQLVQGIVVFLAVVFGFFTSMNQALVGAMMGAGIARGTGTIQWKAIWNIVKGWMIAPISGITITFLLAKLFEIWFPL